MAPRASIQLDAVLQALADADGYVSRAAASLGTERESLNQRVRHNRVLRGFVAHLREQRRARRSAAHLARARRFRHEASHCRWTDPRSPWMATVDVELEPIESGGIGSGWGRAPKQRAA